MWKSSYFRWFCAFLVLVLLAPNANVRGAEPAPQATPAAQAPEKTDRPIYDQSLFFGSYRPGKADNQKPGKVDAANAAPPANIWNKVAFQSYRNSSWGIYLGDNDSGAIYSMYTAKPGLDPRLNKDGTRMVFLSQEGGTYQVTTLNADGTQKFLVTQHTDNCSAPSWSPDGTQIVFARLIDSVSYVYIINADGTGEHQLVPTSAYDGEPSWSPDGSQIAFISYRSGGYRVWVIHPDGSNLEMLPSLPYSSNPVWSPDGTQIAFSADEDNDSFLELMVYKIGDNAPQRLVKLDLDWDALSWGWNPGGTRITYTQVHWIQYNGQWYWDTSNIESYDVLDKYSQVLTDGGNTDWNPSWASSDHQAPSAAYSAPAVVPFNYKIFIQPDDFSGSGAKCYYAQYRTSPTDDWFDWRFEWWPQVVCLDIDKPFSVTEFGGTSIYARIRVEDRAGNISPWESVPVINYKVEDLPPITSMQNLPTYLPNSSFTVSWKGIDQGNSGLGYYYVQYRDGASGSWVDWQYETQNTQATFTGSVGHSYYFRVRGMDNARNYEAWPPDDGDTHTSIYNLSISGKVTDLSGAPLTGVSVTAGPGITGPVVSGVDGNYSAYALQTAASYTATWTKPGYTMAPLTNFPQPGDPGPDARIHTVLNPGNDQILNGTIEAPLNGNWQVGGNLLAMSSPARYHTGNQSLLLDNQTESPYTSYALIGSYGGETLRIYKDPTGQLYALWVNNHQYGYVAHLTTDGKISEVALVYTGHDIYSGQLAFSIDGGLHVIFTDNNMYSLIYAYRSPAGVWGSAVEIMPVPLNISINSWSMATTPDGFVHVVLLSNFSWNLYHIQRNQVGSWNSMEPVLVPPGAINQWTFLTDSASNLHISWIKGAAKGYSFKAASQPWSPPYYFVAGDPMSSDAYFMIMGLQNNERPYLVWNDPDAHGNIGAYTLKYRQQNSDGSWGDVVELLQAYKQITGVFLYSPQVLYFLTGSTGGGSNYTFYRLENGSLTSLPLPPGISNGFFLVDDDHQMYEALPGGSIMHLYRQNPDRSWVETNQIPSIPDALPQNLLLIGHGIPHLFWANGMLCDSTYTLAEQTGDSWAQQAVSIPISMTTPTLSAFYRLTGWPDSAGNLFEIQLRASGSTTVTKSLVSTDRPTTGWVNVHYDLSDYAGQTITVTFHSHQEQGSFPLWAYMDDVAMGSVQPDSWANSPHNPQYVLPGRTAWLEIDYGNRGGAPYESGTLTITLPVSVTLVQARPAISLTSGSVVTINIPVLPAGNWGKVRLQVQLDPRLELGRMLPVQVALTPQDGELELENNVHTILLISGFRVYLPMLEK